MDGLKGMGENAANGLHKREVEIPGNKKYDLRINNL